VQQAAAAEVVLVQRLPAELNLIMLEDRADLEADQQNLPPLVRERQGKVIMVV
jgi:hypothetical protein